MSSNGKFNSCRFNRHYRISFKIIIRVNLSELAKPFQQGLVFPQFLRHISQRSLTSAFELKGAELIEMLVSSNAIVETLDVIKDPDQPNMDLNTFDSPTKRCSNRTFIYLKLGNAII